MDRTVFNANVDYLEFLNLTTKFDVLVVEDSYTKGHFIKNPYLPSKLSDYKGSNSTIWAICEKGSEMDKLDFEYKSHLNDYDENINVLNKIISDKTNTGIEGSKIDRDEYVRERTNQLTQKICELIEVCESEFKKNATYEAEINELTQRIQKLEKENSEILNSNSWKMTENLRKIGKKFK